MTAAQPLPPIGTAPDEREVVAEARRIAELGKGVRAKAFSVSHWTEKTMQWAMADPAFQTQLFRFVDVFPALGTDADIERHLREYFDGPSVPALVRGGLGLSGRVPGGGRIAGEVARRNIARMAKQFIVGSDAASVVARLGELWRSGAAATVDLLGEHTHSEAEADRYADRLASVVAALIAASRTWPSSERLEWDDRGLIPRVAVAIKPTALAPDYQSLTGDAAVAGAKRRLRPILQMAARDGAQVWFDMERYPVKHLTHRLFAELLAEEELAGLHAGIVVQAYLRDSLQDLEELVAFAERRPQPIAVRLVKGAYFDTETVEARAAGHEVPVFADKAETDANYERCVRYLHAHHEVVRAAFASHNLRSLGYAIAAARAASIKDNGYELQLLYGMAEPVHEAIRRLGFRLRVYAPMGDLVPGMAYLVRRLLENTSNDSFVRLRYAEGTALDALLVPPRIPGGALPGPPARARRAPSDPAAPAPYAPEPPAEWHRHDVREEMAAALRLVGGRLGGAVPARIGGRRIDTERHIVSVDPADPGVVVATSSSCGPAEVELAITASTAAAPGWARTPALERAGVVLRAAAWLRARRLEIAALQVFEAGKGWAEADGDVCEAIDFCEYYAREMLRLDRGAAVQSPPGETNQMSYRGRGVALVIAPWNFPLAILTGMTVAALVTGNAVLLKPAEQTPAIAEVLVEALEAGGLPSGVLSFLPGIGEEVAAPLVSHPAVHTVAFTGSKAVGLSIYEAAGRTVAGQRELRRVVAEMGGKNALVIDDDADLDEAVPAAVQSAFGFAGQRCSAASRLVVLDRVYDAFLERFVEATRAMKIGHPSEMGSELGPVIDEEAKGRIEAWQQRAVAGEFGRLALVRDDLPAKGYFVGPTIVEDVRPDSPLAREEIFGPVVAVLRASSFDEAIRIANDGEYSLTAGCISRSPSRIKRAANELDAGNVYINRTIIGAVVGRQPFGGHAMSGGGTKAGGPDYLLSFVNPKVVTENTVRQGFAPLEEGATVAAKPRPTSTRSLARRARKAST